MKEAAAGSTRCRWPSRDFALVRVWLERVATARLPDVAAGGPADGLGGAGCAGAREPASSRYARAAVGARRDEPAAEVAEPARFAEFTTLFAAHADVPHLVVTFLALLELARERLVIIAQAEPYAPIYVQRTGAPGFALERGNPIRATTLTQWTI